SKDEAVQLFNDFFEIDFTPSGKFTNVDTNQFINYFGVDIYESGTRTIYTFTSGVVREVDGVAYYGTGGLVQVRENMLVDGFSLYDGIYVSDRTFTGYTD